MTKTISRVLCLLAAGTLTGCAARSAGVSASARTHIVPATIWVTPYLGSCVATTVPYRIQVKKNEHVEWSIVDLCGATQGYTKDFELKWTTTSGNCSDGTQNPLVGDSKGKTHVRRGINPNCDDNSKVFKYSIWVDGTQLGDPELELGQ
jgi:hypothetical protein